MFIRQRIIRATSSPFIRFEEKRFPRRRTVRQMRGGPGAKAAE